MARALSDLFFGCGYAEWLIWVVSLSSALLGLTRASSIVPQGRVNLGSHN